MLEHRLDPTILKVAHERGFTYLEAAKEVCDSPGRRQLPLADATFMVDYFEVYAAPNLFDYEPVNDVILIEMPSYKATNTLVTDANSRDFYVQSVWEEPSGVGCWCTSVLPDASVTALLSLLNRERIAARLADIAEEHGEFGNFELAIRFGMASLNVRWRRP
jgi:hypothetical protein